MEIWRPITDFELLYAVSNFGNVKSLHKCNPHNGRCWPEKHMKLHVHNNGYHVVWLRKPGVHQKFFVHRLVAFHFIEVIDGKDFVNHKDKNRVNNHVDNLEFMTHQENCEHRDNYQPYNDEPF